MKRESGFTAVEMIITVIVAAMFIIAINALYSAIVKSSSSQRNRAEASDLAYANLRQYVYTGATAEDWFTCSSATDGASKSGQELLSSSQQSIGAGNTSIPQPVKLSVKAIAPYGCSGANLGKPILVRSTITYGPSNDQIAHAAYVEY